MNAEFGPVTDGGNVLVRAVRRAGPASFPVVMATGIVSAALRQAGQPSLSAALLVIAVAVFVILLAASAVRAVAFPASLRADLGRPDRAFTSFAFVAACGVLGYRLAGGGYRLPAAAAAGAALAAWLGVTCLVPCATAAWALTFIGLVTSPLDRRHASKNCEEIMSCYDIRKREPRGGAQAHAGR
jgi:tellurite resistance protein TehA-like permease